MSLQIIAAAETLMSMSTSVPVGMRHPTEAECRRGLPVTFFVRDMVRPNGRKDKEFFSPSGQKFRSIKSAAIVSA